MNLGAKLDEYLKAKEKGGPAASSSLNMDQFVLAYATQKRHELEKIENGISSDIWFEQDGSRDSVRGTESFDIRFWR